VTAPGPPGRFLVDNLPEFARDILGFMERCARDDRSALSSPDRGRSAGGSVPLDHAAPVAWRRSDAVGTLTWATDDRRER
jgi:hypothetical protein